VVRVFSHQPLLLSQFSPGDKIRTAHAISPVCWIVHVEFKVHRPRDGLSVSNALLLGQSLPAFIGLPDQIELERFSKMPFVPVCSLLLRTVRLSCPLF
jgi:hypothetical protein